MKKFLLLAILAATFPAKAEVLTFNFTGAITTVEVNDQNTTSSSLNGTSISVGHTIKGTFSYDTKTPVGVAEPWKVGYWSNGSPNNFGFTIDQSGFSFQQSSSAYSTNPAIYYENYSGSSVTMRTLVERFDLKNYAWNDAFALFFTSHPDSSMPLTPSMLTSVSPTAFLDRTFRYRYSNYAIPTATGSASSLQVNGTITSLQLVTQPVPEPATYAMLLAGLASIGLVAHRRQARR